MREIKHHFHTSDGRGDGDYLYIDVPDYQYQDWCDRINIILGE